MVSIGFVHNLIRRHPSCMVLLHRPVPAAATADAAATAVVGADPYNESEPDPASSRAVESSLWELDALRRHYCPQVSTFVTLLDKDLGDRAHTSEVDLDPLLGASYSSLISAEVGRRLKAAPVAFYARAPDALFGSGGGGGGAVEGEEARPAEAAAGGGNAALRGGLPGWDVEALPPAVA
jgi:U3 small nucleolar RNA-associated protein 19